jgi:hypothetical protein
MLFLFPLCAPIIATVFAPLTALCVVGAALLFKHGASTYGITLGLPTMIATLCWVVEQRTTPLARVARFSLNVVLPLACMVAFGAHAVGGQALAYTLYWLVPPALLGLSNASSTLNAALRITFITHAVGSVLWLYALPTTPAYWLALIPVVAVERLCFAGVSAGMVALLSMADRRTLKNPYLSSST